MLASSRTLIRKVASYTASCEQAKLDFLKAFRLHEKFVSTDEEKSLVNEVNPKLLRRKYEPGHWDGAIKLYREIEKREWNEQNSKVIERFRSEAFSENEDVIGATHVLDLSEDGCILPHVDSIKFCGDIVSGISLLSPSVMRFSLEANTSIFCDVIIPRFSLYVMSDVIRYKYRHEILPNPARVRDHSIVRTRRISLLLRSEVL